MPYRFLEDIATADVAFEAWGETREELFTSGADALLATMTESPRLVERVETVEVELDEAELDMLLFAFLQELIFLKDARRLLLHVEDVRIEKVEGGFCLAAIARGEKIAPERHQLLTDVKAVTLHRFSVTCAEGIWKATVVLDV